ncbi:hypothetical protein [Georgenia thermotolerans]|uniref:Uncharacterized protein n=1 Tax=Georgenia thermotolerans TaxID=527326 RepID=A0A7J5USV0_9MICO|nr:hypothetical protein [Georgenia thermotolerans]KAE8765350.1 hypothetical protein GB883_04095 [Georgenia thermotolerans]
MWFEVVVECEALDLAEEDAVLNGPGANLDFSGSAWVLRIPEEAPKPLAAALGVLHDLSLFRIRVWPGGGRAGGGEVQLSRGRERPQADFAHRPDRSCR